MALRLRITEVTDIHPGTYCVAAWDAVGRRMVRPLPDGIHWPRALIETHRVAPGATIAVAPNGIRPRGDYPHRTEDLPIDVAAIEHLGSESVDWLAPDAPFAATTVNEAFGGHIRDTSLWRGHRRGAHVLAGTRTCSLHGLRAPSHRLTFVEAEDRPRALLQDAEARYTLPVTCRRLRAIWQQAGIAAMRRALPSGTDLHIRLGLARGFGEHCDKCYVMLNGVLW
ncbi:MAG TPA: hypothetical protein VMB34_28940 [Acetobacteraceae bacterium]|nr:hypothetical protein [Acetobacteraceae bacterium]